MIADTAETVYVFPNPAPLTPGHTAGLHFPELFALGGNRLLLWPMECE
jgi:hypothetical protein